MFNTNAMQELNKLVAFLEEKIPLMDKVNTTISAATVGWHIQHSLLVINSIINGLKQSDPNTYQWKFNLSRTLIWTIGKIPRGKGKAPKVVQPQAEITKELLLEHVEKAKSSVALLHSIQKNQYFLHPYFGHLNLKPTIKFLKIHTKHHLDIINDIAKAKA
jgi:hypothetical protein